MAILAAVTPVSDLLIQGTWIAACHLPIGAVFILFLFLLARPLTRHLLDMKDLITIYVLMLVGAGVPSLGLSAYLIPILAAPTYYATPENEWASLFFHHIPTWMAPMDSRAARFFYEGLPSGGMLPWRIWIKPLALWSIFALAMFAVMYALCVILRRQWVEQERLIFPLVQLPLEMIGSDERSPFFRNRLMWLGFAVPFLIHLWNGLHFHIPVVPGIRLFYDLGRYLTEKPWNIMRPLWAIVHFSVIGFVYLLPTDLSFSLWFFYFLFHAQSVIGVMMGRRIGNVTGYAVRDFAAYQMAGALATFVLLALWRARGNLKAILRKAFLNDPKVDDSHEPLPFRGAILMLAFGLFTMIVWSVMAGVSWGWITAVLVIFVFTLIGMTRMVSEGGLLFIQTPYRPLDLISPVVGTARIPPATLTILAFQEMIFMFDIRSMPMPSMMDALKLSDRPQFNRRRLSLTMSLSILIAMMVSYVSVLWICYSYGGINLSRWFCVGAPQLPFRRLSAMLINPQEPNGIYVLYMVVGAGVMLGLSLMRGRFLWWPFHPLGYAMGPSWPMIQLWFSILIGWSAKSVIMRYGGIRSYRVYRPMFLGMVLGEFIAGGVWLIIDFLAGKGGHRIFLF
jgi:hypothetical protein